MACTAVAAELIANYACIPDFNPGPGYLRALGVVLILDVLGTILVMMLARLGRPLVAPRAEADPA